MAQDTAYCSAYLNDIGSQSVKVGAGLVRSGCNRKDSRETRPYRYVMARLEPSDAMFSFRSEGSKLTCLSWGLETKAIKKPAYAG
ncbi:MAG: hypothetical protein RID09_31680 [Coleofasciculus sp. G1-WW12-02]|uniref:hypothetical protein n=1 Tax=Coleofasciculus sp. G1-WW12-02 TaxID=3068483 RepID=UPI00330483DE